MGNYRYLLGAVACAAAWASWPAAAFEARDGFFVAERACAATPRIRDRGGPDAVEVGTSYRLLGANRADPTHYQIRLAAPDRDRWVAAGCGRAVASCAPGDAGCGGGGGAGGGEAREHVLAVSWQPAFCEGHPGKPECASQAAGRFDATHFTLHGLWPQPRSAVYCGVGEADQALDRPGTWHLLPPVELSAETRAALDEMMPGTQSALDRHEWVKHGTCYGASQEEYFRESLQLLAEVNASAVRAVLAGRIGGEVTAGQLGAAFDAAFGAGAGDRVAMDCDRDGRRELLVELRLNLAGEITETSRLADLLAAAPPAAPGCRVGVVDPVGLD